MRCGKVAIFFNVGPDGRGYLAERDQAFMGQLGRWLRTHGEAVFGTRPGKIYPTPVGGQGASFHYGMFTQRGTDAYLTLFYYPQAGHLTVSRITPDITQATLLTTGQELQLEPLSNGRTRISGLPEVMPIPLAAVIKLTFSSEPHFCGLRDASWLTGEHVPEAIGIVGRETDLVFFESFLATLPIGLWGYRAIWSQRSSDAYIPLLSFWAPSFPASFHVHSPA